MRIKITVSYDGTNYNGWQVQPNGVTVQQVLEDALFNATGERTRITGSGRTDAGVHAQGQVAHFDTQSTIPPERFYKALNAYLPEDIRVLDSMLVQDDFHACNGAKRKTYRYSAYFKQTNLPLMERYAVKLDNLPDLEKMKECAQIFVGEHDFKAFCASGSGAKTTVRTIFDIKIEKEGEKFNVLVTGNGFLYNMVRIMSGAIFGVGCGEISLLEVKEMLDLKKRLVKVKTFPPKALCLVKVEY